MVAIVALGSALSGCAASGLQDRVSALRDFTREDVSAALALARAQGDTAAVICWSAVQARTEALPPVPPVVGAAYAYQRARGFRRIADGSDDLHIACAAMVSESETVIRRLVGILVPVL